MVYSIAMAIPGICAARYPLLMVHGYAGRDEGRLPYWGGIPARLRAEGATVFLAGNGGFATIEEGARQIDRRVEEIRSSTGSDKVNIVAHSMGGLDTRYYISSLERGDRVASLLTVSTPHRGSALADFFLGEHPRASRRVGRIIDLLSRGLKGERESEAYEAALELRPSACAAFNEANPDDPRVHYRSYASTIDGNYRVRAYAALHRILYPREGDNDGFVSVASARWGDFRGIVGADEGLSISHDEIHDLRRFRVAEIFDAPAFFSSAIAELVAMGL
jgi:triacylglycerol lipase